MKTFATIIADKLKSARKTASMSEISARCGVSREHLYRIACGQQDPSLETAEKIARGLGLILKISDK